MRADLSDDELDGLDRLVDALPGRLAELAACGLPDSLVHGDLHPGNWVGDPERQVLIDWGDSVLGSPAFDAHTLIRRVQPAFRDAVTAAWRAAWSRHVPDADPVRALELAEVVAALRSAAVYRRILDAIERTERRYHDRDPAAMIRVALAGGSKWPTRRGVRRQVRLEQDADRRERDGGDGGAHQPDVRAGRAGGRVAGGEVSP